MGIFGRGKKDRVIDLAERYKKQQRRVTETKDDVIDLSQTPMTSSISTPTSETTPSTNTGGMFNFFGGGSTPTPTPNESSNESLSEDKLGKKRKLVKRFMDMTTKIEDLSNQLYHLQQRVELLEKKRDVNY